MASAFAAGHVYIAVSMRNGNVALVHHVLTTTARVKCIHPNYQLQPVRPASILCERLAVRLPAATVKITLAAVTNQHSQREYQMKQTLQQEANRLIEQNASREYAIAKLYQSRDANTSINDIVAAVDKALSNTERGQGLIGAAIFLFFCALVVLAFCVALDLPVADLINGVLTSIPVR